MKATAMLIFLGCVYSAVPCRAADLKQSKLTEVVNEVQIITAADQRSKPAAVNDVFSIPDILRTGAASRAELVAQDATVTRVGANTIFSFDPGNRTIDLKEGSLLFHAPHGKGGGTIHTGSATASVLGTTIIITTTPNGGFKVIALEGHVEVKLPNGLEQRLNPGQMTFILPGGKRLAPIIIFRLDELIEHSLLVKGFGEPLQSLPLIQNEIETQLKLIRSGRLGDTGFIAGESATPDQVEVLDINTIAHGQQTQNPTVQPPGGPPLSPVAAASGADATISQPSLTDVTIPTPPVHVFANQKFDLTGNAYFSGRNFQGFLARNIFMNPLPTDTRETAPPLVIDLSPYDGLASFDMVAANDFKIAGSISFTGLSSSSDLTLAAGNQFRLTPGVSLTAEVHTFSLLSPATLTINNGGLFNDVGDISLGSGGGVLLQNGGTIAVAGQIRISSIDDIIASGTSLTGNGALIGSLMGAVTLDKATLKVAGVADIIGATALNFNNANISSGSAALYGLGNTAMAINDTTINGSSSVAAMTSGEIDVTGTASGGSALLSDPASGSVSLSSSAGSIHISGTTISAHYLTLNSGDGILLDASGHALVASGPAAMASLTAPNLITVRNTDFSPFALVNMAANTIVLVNDIFSTTGIYNFGTQTGQVVINGQNPGGLALIGCSLGRNPISIEDIDITSAAQITAGIHSYPR